MSNRDGILQAVFGMKGSGKSYFVQRCIKSVPRLIVFDPKRSYRKAGVADVVISDGGEVGRKKLLAYLAPRHATRFRVIYEPAPLQEVEELHEVSRLIELLQEPYLNEESDLKTMLVVEEAHTASPNPPNPKFNGFARLVTMGRESGIDIIPVTQRPQAISMFIRDNADRVACFQVSGEPAVEAAARTMAAAENPTEAIRSLAKYEFVFFENSAWEKRRPLS